MFHSFVTFVFAFAVSGAAILFAPAIAREARRTFRVFMEFLTWKQKLFIGLCVTVAAIAQTSLAPVGGYNFFGGGNVWGNTVTATGGQSDAGANGNSAIALPTNQDICLDGTTVGNPCTNPNAGLTFDGKGLRAGPATRAYFASTAPALVPMRVASTIIPATAGACTWTFNDPTVLDGGAVAFNSDAGVPVYCGIDEIALDGGASNSGSPGTAYINDTSATGVLVSSPSYTSVVGHVSGAVDLCAFTCIGPI